jgi:hypothetical protein
VRDRRVQMRAGQDGSAMGPAAPVASAINDDVGRRAACQFGAGVGAAAYPHGSGWHRQNLPRAPGGRRRNRPV